MVDPSADQRRRRARRVLAVVAGVLVVVVAVAGVIAARRVTSPSQQQVAAPSGKPSAVPEASATDSSGWDVAAQRRLARRPMVTFPQQAATPHRMSTRRAGPAIALPEPETVRGRWIPTGFPATPQGALAQLKALNEAALAGGGDPAVYARAYRQMSLPGAPQPQETGLYALLTSMRPADAPARGPIPGWTVRYEVTHGLIKGTTDGGRYAVVCVLGQFSVSYQGRSLSRGVGDCQAMRYVDGAWQISPGAMASPAPNTWPGTEEAVRAGYRELT